MKLREIEWKFIRYEIGDVDGQLASTLGCGWTIGILAAHYFNNLAIGFYMTRVVRALPRLLTILGAMIGICLILFRAI